MKKHNFISSVALALFIALAPSSVRADGAGVYWGTMNTQLFGKGKVVGGIYEISPVPLLALQLRGGYARGFDKFNIKPPPADGLNAHELALNNMLFGGLNGANRAQMKNFTVVPIEVGVIGRTSVLGFAGVYAGVGYGYYIVPAFTVSSRSGIDHVKNVKDISGWWGLIGVEGGMPNVKLFAEMKYSRAISRDIDIELEYMGYKGSFNADINLSGVSYMIGVKLSW